MKLLKLISDALIKGHILRRSRTIYDHLFYKKGDAKKGTVLFSRRIGAIPLMAGKKVSGG